MAGEQTLSGSIYGRRMSLESLHLDVQNYKRRGEPVPPEVQAAYDKALDDVVMDWLPYADLLG